MSKNTIQAKPQKILVVDDEPVIRDMMIDILAIEGYDIVTARNGQEALTKLKGEESYLIFLDVMMPVMDGIQFCQQLTAHPEQRQRQIVVLMSALDHLARATSLNIDAIMPKPFVVDDVMRLIDRYM